MKPIHLTFHQCVAVPTGSLVCIPSASHICPCSSTNQPRRPQILICVRRLMPSVLNYVMQTIYEAYVISVHRLPYGFLLSYPHLTIRRPSCLNAHNTLSVD